MLPLSVNSSNNTSEDEKDLINKNNRREHNNKSPTREKRFSNIETSRLDFYQKFQTLGKQRQIAQVSQDDPSKLVVVHQAIDNNYGLLSPEKKTLRRLRSRTLPEMQSPDKNGNVKKLSNEYDDDDILKSPSGNASSPIPARAPKGEKQKVSSNTVGKAQEAILSPRSIYIEACMREGLNPRASLVLKQKNSKELHLEHQVNILFTC